MASCRRAAAQRPGCGAGRLDAFATVTAPDDSDDNNPCTRGTCTPQSGCQHAPLADGEGCPNGVLCDGDGVTSSDLALFDYRKRRRPLYPFEKDIVLR